MAVAKLECPDCGAVLRPAKPVAPGKKVTCPKCATVFVVPAVEEEDEPEDRVTAKKPLAKKAPVVVDDDEDEDEDEAPRKKPAKPEPKKAVKPEPKKPEEEVETYGMAKDPDDEDDHDPKGKKGGKKKKKPVINYAPDLTVKDPRGPATLALAMPSNLMIGTSAINILMTVLAIAIFWWPALFTKYGTTFTPGEARQEYERAHPPALPGGKPPPKKADDDDKPVPEVKLEELKPEERALFDEVIEFEWFARLIVMGIGLTSLLFWGCCGYGAVKMQNLESYGWSMTAAIMSIIGAGYSVAAGSLWCIFTIWIPPVCLAAGIIALINLRKPKVIEAFAYDPEKQ